MTRRGVSLARAEAAALQASRRMVSRGERPAYRIRVGQDGSWTITETPWLAVDAVDRREVIKAAVAVIAAWLDCDPTAFDVEVDD